MASFIATQLPSPSEMLELPEDDLSPASALCPSGCAGVVAGLVVFFHERLDNVVAQSVLVWG